MTDAPYAAAEGGLRLFVRLQPGASRAQLGGLREGAEGRVFLEARVPRRPKEARPTPRSPS